MQLYSSSAVDAFRKFCTSIDLKIPKVQVVLGSGFGAALEKAEFPGWMHKGDLEFREIPGLNPSTAPDHKGAYRFFEHDRSKSSVVFQMGRLHGYEGNSPQQVVAPLMVPRLAGTENFLLTNAAGGLRPEMKPGDVMVMRDHVNLTGKNPLIGENPRKPDGSEIGPRFPDLCGIYDADWRKALKTRLEKESVRTHEGVYIGVLGPSFETPAEVSLFSSWGMGSVGMSTVWEAIAVRHSGARVAGLSLISNLGAGMGGGVALDHFAILETSRVSASKIVHAAFGAIEAELRL